MKITTRALVALLAAGVAAPALAQPGAAAPSASAAGQPKADIRPSKQALKALSELQAAVKSNDHAAIQAKVAAAQAVVSTREDRYLLAQLQAQAAINAKDNAALVPALDAIAASGFVDAPKMASLYVNLGASFYNEKQFDKAGAAFERASALDPRNYDAIADLGEVRFAQGRKAEAAHTFQRAIQAKVAMGLKADENLYKRALEIAYEANAPESADLARQWVAAYPSADSWRNSIGIYRSISHMDDDGIVDLLRLLRATGAMTDASDFAMYLQALNFQSNYIEAQSALDKAGPLASDPTVKEAAANVASKPRVTAAELTAAAKSAQTGIALLHIGDRFYGLGDYAKAVETYKQAQTKGADANLVKERVGVALAASGDKAGATTAFKSVTGPRAGVAQFWLLYLGGAA